MSTKHFERKKLHIRPLWILVFVIFAIYAVSLCIPVVWAFLMSMMTRVEFNTASTGIKLPSSFNLSNYLKAWTELATNGYGMVPMLINSIWFAIGGAGSATLATAASAYVTTKYRFPGRKIILVYAWATLMIPVMGTMASSLRFYRMLHATNSPLFLLACISGVGTSYLYMVSSFKGLSWEYAESAFMDGAGHFTTFFKIMLPQVKPVMIALFVEGFIGLWNNSETPLIFFPEMPTLSTGLLMYQTVAARSVNYPLLFAALIMCMIPTMVLFTKFSETLMNLNLGGGIKG